MFARDLGQRAVLRDISIRTGVPEIVSSARSSSPCTVIPLACTWNPWYRVPSYATTARQFCVLGYPFAAAAFSSTARAPLSNPYIP